MTESVQKFCGDCGKSLVPLKTMHVSRPCKDCGKTIFVAEPGEGGNGIKIEKGDSFHIPAGLIQISLDPRSTGTLFQAGISFLIEQMILAGYPNSIADLEKSLEFFDNEAERFLKESELTKKYDFKNEADVIRVTELLKENKSSREWWAFVMGVSAEIAQDAIRENDSKKAAWAMYKAVAGFAMFQMKDKLVEDTLWKGYLANKSVFGAAAAHAKSKEEANAYKLLQYKIMTISEAELEIYLKDNRPIGPRIGVVGIPDETIKPLLEYQVKLLERKRQEQRERKEYKIRWATVIVSSIAAILGSGITLLVVNHFIR